MNITTEAVVLTGVATMTWSEAEAPLLRKPQFLDERGYHGDFPVRLDRVDLRVKAPLGGAAAPAEELASRLVFVATGTFLNESGEATGIVFREKIAHLRLLTPEAAEAVVTLYRDTHAKLLAALPTVEL